MTLAVRCQKLVSVPFWGFEMAGVHQKLCLEQSSKACWHKCTWVPLHRNWYGQLELLS